MKEIDYCLCWTRLCCWGGITALGGYGVHSLGWGADSCLQGTSSIATALGSCALFLDSCSVCCALSENRSERNGILKAQQDQLQAVTVQPTSARSSMTR